jgi:hypothetical protein
MNFEVARSILAIGVGKGTWQKATGFEGKTLRIKSRRRIPEDLGAATIIAIHQEGTHGERSMFR